MKSKLVLKAFSGIVCLSMLVTTFTGCLNNSSDSSSSTSNSTNSAAAGGGSFSYTVQGKFCDWTKDLAWFPELEKATNTTVNFINGGSDESAYYQAIDLGISSNKLKDALIAKSTQVQVYGSQGAFIDMKPLIEKYAPNLKKYIDSNSGFKKFIETDGKIYGIPSQMPLETNVVFYRSDMLKKAGITTAPTTIDELTNAFETLKKTYSSVSGYYPLIGRNSFLNFGWCFGAENKIDSDGKIQGIYDNGITNSGFGFNMKSPGFRKMIEWYNTLYTKELIDPEWVAGTSTEESWQTKYLNSKGTFCYDDTTRSSWFMNNGGPQNDPNYDVQPMEMVKDLSGNTVKQTATQYNTNRIFVISHNTSEETQVTIIKFLDYLYSQEGQDLVHYGVVGKTSKVVDGKHIFICDYSAENVKPLGQINYGIYQGRLTFPYPIDNEAYYASKDKLTTTALNLMAKTAAYAPQFAYTTEQIKERSAYEAKIETDFNAMILAFVIGKTPINDANWNAFLTKMDEDGYSKVVEIDQAAYDASK